MEQKYGLSDGSVYTGVSDRLTYLNNKRVLSDEGNIIIPKESVADIWDTFSEPVINQLKRDFNIDYTRFELQLKSTELWRLEEMVTFRLENNEDKLKRLRNYEGNYGLPVVSDRLNPLAAACKNEESIKAMGELLDICLCYNGLMKDCPDYNQLAREAVDGGWACSDLTDKATLYNTVVDHAERFTRENEEKVRECMRVQEKCRTMNDAGERAGYGRGR